MPDPHLSRRGLLSLSAAGAAAFTVPGRFAEELETTPALTEGPFYPDKLPLDTDNDLLILNDSITPAVGTITHLSGRVLSKAGIGIRNAFVEIWQVDAKGSYLHSKGAGDDGRDENFQGYGRFLTDAEGRYSFRTIQPVPYDRRAPHIHIAVSANGKRLLTTQLLIDGHAMNDKDGVLRKLGAEERKRIVAPFRTIPDSKLGELAVAFDVVLGSTPADPDSIEGGISKPQGAGRGPGRERR